MTKKQVDLGARQKAGNWAVYLPAISGFYTIQLGKMDAIPGYAGRPLPAKFENGHEGLNFLDPEKAYYYYPYGLFSAGHAQLKLDKANATDPMVQTRDRSTSMILGDSGGFQIATGVLKLDWATIKGPEGDALREQILRWLEYTADWSMTLDVPAFAADTRFAKKTGLKKFEDTIDITLHNLEYFVKNRKPGATKFLNVLSGSTPENSKVWFDEVIKYSIPACVEAMGHSPDRTTEGYAFAGINMKHMPSVLNRLLDLRELDALKDKDWIHFLGIGRLDWACYLTSIMRELRKHDNPNIVLSFDAASPFVATAYGLTYTYNSFNSKRLTYSMDSGIDDKDLKGSQMAMPWQGPIMDRLVTGDMCVLGHGDKNKMKKEGRTSWDSFTYALYMAHNVYNHIDAVQEINRLADVEHATRDIKYTDWSKQKGNSSANEVSEYVPSSILFFDDFVEKLFDPANPDPRGMIKEYGTYLEKISFGGTGSEVTVKNVSNSLFDWDSIKVTQIDQDELADTRNEKSELKMVDLFNLFNEEDSN
jgi:hypothetical protein